MCTEQVRQQYHPKRTLGRIMWVLLVACLKLLLVCGMGRLLFEGLLQWTHEGPHHVMAGLHPTPRPVDVSSWSNRAKAWTRSSFRFRSTWTSQPPPLIPLLVPSNLTLREFLLHPDGFHLAMGPAFFGYFAYFGALITLDEAVGVLHFSHGDEGETSDDGDDITMEKKMLLKSVAGASAGAMAAVLLSAGIPPRRAAQFASQFSLTTMPQQTQTQIITKQQHDAKNPLLQNGTHLEHNINPNIEDDDWKPRLALQDGLIPVAVSGFDLWTMRVKLLSQGPMARAARSSACFPGLFQPVPWWDDDDSNNDNNNHDKNDN
eukprot:scaffold84772_cov41-Attheya_sp.AAC.3